MRTAPLPRGRRRLALLTLAAMLSIGGLTGACAGSGTTTVTAASDHVIGVVVWGQDRAAPEGSPSTTVPVVSAVERWQVRDDLGDERRIVPLDVRVDPDDPTLLRIRFEAGPASCHGARVAIDEQAATVRVLLFVGTPPEGNVACPDTAVQVEVAATLSEPLGTRELLGDVAR